MQALLVFSELWDTANVQILFYHMHLVPTPLLHLRTWTWAETGPLYPQYQGLESNKWKTSIIERTVHESHIFFSLVVAHSLVNNPHPWSCKQPLLSSLIHQVRLGQNWYFNLSTYSTWGEKVFVHLLQAKFIYHNFYNATNGTGWSNVQKMS